MANGRHDKGQLFMSTLKLSMTELASNLRAMSSAACERSATSAKLREFASASAYASSNEETVPDHYSSFSIVDCRPATCSFTQ